MTKQKRHWGSWLVIALFAGSGVVHLVWPEAFLPLMPPVFPAPILLIVLSGVGELTAAIGLILRLRFAPAFTVLVLLTVWPANWWFAFEQTVAGPWWLAILAWLRVPLQIPLIVWAWQSPRRKRRELAP